jgi:hypothetical protein
VADPLGQPSLFFRKRSVEEHLSSHGRETIGRIVDYRPVRTVRPMGAPPFDEGGYARVVFDAGGSTYKIKEPVPAKLQDYLRTGDQLEIEYCPYYPKKTYRIIWPSLR